MPKAADFMTYPVQQDILQATFRKIVCLTFNLKGRISRNINSRVNAQRASKMLQAILGKAPINTDFHRHTPLHLQEFGIFAIQNVMFC